MVFKYIQSHTTASPINEGIRESRGMQEGYDDVVEAWFESEQNLMEAMSSSEGLEISAILLKNEGNFIDHVKSTAFIAQEYAL